MADLIVPREYARQDWSDGLPRDCAQAWLDVLSVLGRAEVARALARDTKLTESEIRDRIAWMDALYQKLHDAGYHVSKPGRSLIAEIQEGRKLARSRLIRP